MTDLANILMIAAALMLLYICTTRAFAVWRQGRKVTFVLYVLGGLVCLFSVYQRIEQIIE